MRQPPKSRPKVPSCRPDHALVPDRATLDRYLAGLLGFMSDRRYDAAATLALVPAWLRFLESRNLLSAERHRQALQELDGLRQQLHKLFSGETADPALRERLGSWGRQEAGSPAPEKQGTAG